MSPVYLFLAGLQGGLIGVRIGFIVTSIIAVAWFITVAMLVFCYGWKNLWTVLAVPLILYWPLMYGIMDSCLVSNSCP
jgi:hypothetical protein